MVKGLRHVVETYIMFDEDGSGTIDRKEVMAMITERKGGGSCRVRCDSRVLLCADCVCCCQGARTALLSEDRWQEMDWDKDGCITFKVCCMSKLA